MHVCSLFYTFILKNKYDFYLLEYLLDFMLLGLAKNRQYLSEIIYLGDYCGISISNMKWKPTIRISLGETRQGWKYWLKRRQSKFIKWEI